MFAANTNQTESRFGANVQQFFAKTTARKFLDQIYFIFFVHNNFICLIATKVKKPSRARFNMKRTTQIGSSEYTLNKLIQINTVNKSGQIFTSNFKQKLLNFITGFYS